MPKTKRESTKTKQEGAWYSVHLHDSGIIKQLKKLEATDTHGERSATYYGHYNVKTGLPVGSPIFAAVVQAKDEDEALAKADRMKRGKIAGEERGQ